MVVTSMKAATARTTITASLRTVTALRVSLLDRVVPPHVVRNVHPERVVQRPPPGCRAAERRPRMHLHPAVVDAAAHLPAPGARGGAKAVRAAPRSGATVGEVVAIDRAPVRRRVMRPLVGKDAEAFCQRHVPAGVPAGASFAAGRCERRLRAPLGSGLDFAHPSARKGLRHRLLRSDAPKL